MNSREKREFLQWKKYWQKSFFMRAIAFRYLLTPLGTINMSYRHGDMVLTYLDVYVFGFRIARFHLKG